MSRAEIKSKAKSPIAKRGFTLVESLLSLAYVSMLLLSVLLIILQLIHIYNRGMTLKELNRVGRSVGDDIQLSLNTASDIKISQSDSNTNSTNFNPINDPREEVPDYRTDSAENPWRGVLCTGNFSYVWNFASIDGKSGQFFMFNAFPDYLFKITGPDGRDYPVRLAKIQDPNREVCRMPNGVNDIIKNQSNRVTEVIKAGDRGLAIHDFRIVSAVNSGVTGQTMYTLNYVIGTSVGSRDDPMWIEDSKCRPPDKLGYFNDYCAINKFEVTARNISREK